MSVLAGLATRILPMVVNKFLPLDPTLYSVVGAGGTYVVGSMLKKPDLANAGIALGLVELVAPMVEDLIGGITGSAPMVRIGVPSGIKTINPAITGGVKQVNALNDYGRLNDYIGNPEGRQSKVQYANSY